ncbi:hypothetical protein FVE85_1744 [Porphyridium purpureum]|uniref:Uncharacterized protein n=1 Tax=Porphyridium purpureum TaxID=35688 RepID=A0A5J4YVQ3_PORPP|nr:hypothetical protein FVE85_1744 [Porphyridium purpureum]|eukprot:POR2430..scf209_3
MESREPRKGKTGFWMATYSKRTPVVWSTSRQHQGTSMLLRSPSTSPPLRSMQLRHLDSPPARAESSGTESGYVMSSKCSLPDAPERRLWEYKLTLEKPCETKVTRQTACEGQANRALSGEMPALPAFAEQDVSTSADKENIEPNVHVDVHLRTRLSPATRPRTALQDLEVTWPSSSRAHSYRESNRTGLARTRFSAAQSQNPLPGSKKQTGTKRTVQCHEDESESSEPIIVRKRLKPL